MYIKKKVDGVRYRLEAPNVGEWRAFKDKFIAIVEMPTLEMWVSKTVQFTQSIQDKIKKKEPLTEDDEETITKLEKEAELYNSKLLKLIVKKPVDFDVSTISIPAQTELMTIATRLVSGLPEDKKKV